MAFFENVGKTIVSDVLSNYFLGGVATVVGLTIASKVLKTSGKPLLVGATKEVMSFKQWLSSVFAEGKEFCGDVSAEAKHIYTAEVDARLNILQRQQEILEKLKASI